VGSDRPPLPITLLAPVLAMLLAACQAKAPAPAPLPAVEPPRPAATPAPPAPSQPHVVVVDLQRATQAHPRWADLQALDRRMGDLETELAVAPTVSPADLPRIDLGPAMKAEAQRQVEALRPEVRKEYADDVAAEQDAAKKELEAYAAVVRADGQAQFKAKHQALSDALTKAIQDKQAAIQADNNQFELQMFQQYRLPLLNLRLKQQTVQQTTQQQSDQLGEQIDALTKERDDKVAAHEKANAQAFEDFQKQQSEQFTAEMTAFQQQLSDNGQKLLDQKTAEINARLKQDLTAKQAELTARLNAEINARLKVRQQVLVTGAQQQMAAMIDLAQQKASVAARARAQALNAQLDTLRGERARLLGSILADIRVEVAALAQDQGYDVVLTQAVANLDVVDVTDVLIARMKR
jgi:hypothetical protein